jgi:hypothetical protein
MVDSEGLFDVEKLESRRSERNYLHFVFSFTQVAGKAAVMPGSAD